MAEFDLIIKNGLIIDGENTKPFVSDIAIKKGLIEAFGNFTNEKSKKSIDVMGEIVTPGFIDAHTHDESFLLGKGDVKAKISQGVTFECVGLCGKSIHPINKKTASLLAGYLGPALGGSNSNFAWSNWDEFINGFPYKNQPLKVASFIGHGSIRISVMGFENRQPSSEELSQMCSLLEKGIEAGCVGLSLGLSYPPGVFAELDELVAMARVAARHGKPVVSHIRNESNYLVEAVREMIEVARQSKCRMIIAHHKAAGEKNYRKVRECIDLIEKACSEGLDIGIDVYPYTAGNTSITALLPPWALEGGIPSLLESLRDSIFRMRVLNGIENDDSWENLIHSAGWKGILISSCSMLPEFEGESLDNLALSMKKSPFDALVEIISITGGQCRVVVNDISEDDMCFVLKHQCAQIISDSTEVVGKPHPRLYGTFPRVLGRYVREKHVLNLVDAINKMTSLPAKRYGLKNRGVLAVGAVADLVVFDEKKIIDTATYSNPRNYCLGISNVISDGKLVLCHGAPQCDLLAVPVRIC
jgi:N-acyl-D-aspartate/D-glutamate deacylase